MTQQKGSLNQGAVHLSTGLPRPRLSYGKIHRAPQGTNSRLTYSGEWWVSRNSIYPTPLKGKYKRTS